MKKGWKIFLDSYYKHDRGRNCILYHCIMSWSHIFHSLKSISEWNWYYKKRITFLSREDWDDDDDDDEPEETENVVSEETFSNVEKNLKLDIDCK